MRAHQINKTTGEILNTLEVPSLNCYPDLIDADLVGGGCGWVYDAKTGKAAPPPVILSDVRLAAVSRINAKAGEIILARLPQWKQSNLTARAVELVSVGSANWTTAEQAEWAAIQAEWAWVKSVRVASNVAATAVNAATDVASIDSAEKSAFLLIK